MALDPKALTRTSANSFMAANVVKQLLFYATNDTASQVETAGYFNNARSRLNVGDIIICSLDVDGTPGCRVYVAATVPATGNVTVTPAAATPIE